MLQPFSVFILKLIRKNFESTHLARAITDFVSFLVFNFRRALNDVICFVACTKNEVNLGFLSQTVPKLCLRHLKVFTNRFYGL